MAREQEKADVGTKEETWKKEVMLYKNVNIWYYKSVITIILKYRIQGGKT